jgi:hypothetical protein
VQGSVGLEGEAIMDASNRYQVSGHVATHGLAFDQGGMHIREASISTGLRMNRERLDLNGLRLAAFGGEFSGDALLENFARFQVHGDLRHLESMASTKCKRKQALFNEAR